MRGVSTRGMVVSSVCAWAFVAFALGGCSKSVAEPAPSEFQPSKPAPLPPGPSKLEIVDDVVGTGAEAATGDQVNVHYTGTLLSGKIFDSSRDREPFSFTLGKGQVIKGWDQGVVGMKVGGKRTLTIPSDLAYGEKGGGDKIPPNAALKFEIELLSIALPDGGAKK